MAKTQTASTTEKKKRAPRTLSDMEREAKQNYDDIKTVAKLLPSIAKLSQTGRDKLAEHIGKLNEAAAAKFNENQQP